MNIRTFRSPIRLVANTMARMEISFALGSRLCRTPGRRELASETNASSMKPNIPSIVFPTKPFLPWAVSGN